MAERLQKIIAASGLMSRRAAEECIAAGRVKVNGLPANLGDKADGELDAITVDGIPLKGNTDKVYIMLNKPKGYVTTLKDEKGRNDVSELVKDVPARLYPVGRLDMYSQGLLIMTNDGEFANLLMHPSHNFKKTYRTWVEGEDVGQSVEYLRLPMEIDGCEVCAHEVDIERVYPKGGVLSITISQGRNRQIRKMCALCGLRVTKLLRISEGPLSLGELKEGCWRYLSQEEIEKIKAAKKDGSEQ